MMSIVTHTIYIAFFLTSNLPTTKMDMASILIGEWKVIEHDSVTKNGVKVQNILKNIYIMNDGTIVISSKYMRVFGKWSLHGSELNISGIQYRKFSRNNDIKLQIHFVRNKKKMFKTEIEILKTFKVEDSKYQSYQIFALKKVMSN